MFASLSQNTNTVNATLGSQLINDAHRYLLQKYFFNERSATITTVGQQQGYNLPYNYSKLKTGTITLGNLRWTPTEIMSREDWDNLNVFPYYSDIPNNYFIYDGKFNLWPIPSTGSTQATYTGLSGTLKANDTITVGTVTGTILTFTGTSMQIAIPQSSNGVTLPTGAFVTSGSATGTISAVTITPGNTITYNYQIRPLDLSIADYVTGTASVTTKSTLVQGVGTSWLANYMPVGGSVKHLNLWIQFATPLGDGAWYQIDSIASATSLTLLNNYNGGTSTGVSYVIGQMPLLLEDFHDLLVYRALTLYYSTINKVPQSAEYFKEMYEMGIESLNNYAGTKALEVNLRGSIKTINPNSYPSSLS